MLLYSKVSHESFKKSCILQVEYLDNDGDDSAEGISNDIDDYVASFNQENVSSIDELLMLCNHDENTTSSLLNSSKSKRGCRTSVLEIQIAADLC